MSRIFSPNWQWGSDGGCGDRGRRTRRSVATGRAAVQGPRRRLRRGGRAPTVVAAGVFRRRYRVYFSLTFEPPLWLGFGATLAGGAASFALHRHPLRCEAALALTLFCAGFALIGETTWQRQAPMLAAPARPRRRHRACRRHRLGRSRLAGHRRPRSVAGADAGRAAGAAAHPHPGGERPVGAGRPRQHARGALPGAGTDPARRPRHAARGLFRPDRRGRLHLRPGAPRRRGGRRPR